MSKAEEIRILIRERAAVDPNDPRLYDYWDRLAEALSDDEEFTLSFLLECDENEIHWISEVFEDISANLNSWKYIERLRELEKKFPRLDLGQDIQEAIDFMG